MGELSRLLKESFDLFVKMRRLKAIDKETSKYHSLKAKTEQQRYVVDALLKRYQEIYGLDLQNQRKTRCEVQNAPPNVPEQFL